MTKIAFVIDTIESPTAGTEKQLLLLIKHLDRSKFMPYLCVLRSSRWLREEFRDCEVVDICISSFQKLESYKNIWHFAHFLKNNGIDIVQTHFVEGNKVGVISAKLAGVKVVVSTRRNQGYWHNAVEKSFLRILNRWTTLFLANSQNTAQWAAKAENIPKSKIDVIYNGIELQQFSSKHEDRIMMRKQLGIKADVPLIGVVANLRPVKGIDVFLNAAKRVVDSYATANFIIIGEGVERHKLEKLSEKLGIEGHVKFLGRRENIPSLLAALDIGVLSSHSESFSNALIEYMAARLPVVCTDVGGAREAVAEGINGYVVPPGDHEALAERILKVLDRSLMQSMGNESIGRVRKSFSLSSTVDRHQALYLKLAGVR